MIWCNIAPVVKSEASTQRDSAVVLVGLAKRVARQSCCFLLSKDATVSLLQAEGERSLRILAATEFEA